MSLPPLPEPAEVIGVVVGDDQSRAYRYTADQLRAAQREMAEECARLIEGYPHWLGENAKREIAAAIRAKFCKSE